MLIETPSVALQRSNFLQQMCVMDLSDKFFDKTWIKQNEYKEKGWTHDTIKCTLAGPTRKRCLPYNLPWGKFEGLD